MRAIKPKLVQKRQNKKFSTSISKNKACRWWYNSFLRSSIIFTRLFSLYFLLFDILILFWILHFLSLMMGLLIFWLLVNHMYFISNKNNRCYKKSDLVLCMHLPFFSKKYKNFIILHFLDKFYHLDKKTIIFYVILCMPNSAFPYSLLLSK